MAGQWTNKSKTFFGPADDFDRVLLSAAFERTLKTERFSSLSAGLIKKTKSLWMNDKSRFLAGA